MTDRQTTPDISDPTRQYDLDAPREPVSRRLGFGLLGPTSGRGMHPPSSVPSPPRVFFGLEACSNRFNSVERGAPSLSRSVRYGISLKVSNTTVARLEASSSESRSRSRPVVTNSPCVMIGTVFCPCTLRVRAPHRGKRGQNRIRIGCCPCVVLGRNSVSGRVSDLLYGIHALAYPVPVSRGYQNSSEIDAGGR